MLDLISKLGKDAVRDVSGILCAEVNAYAFGTDQADDLLDLIQQGPGDVPEEKVRFVKEKYHLGPGKVTDLRHDLKKL